MIDRKLVSDDKVKLLHKWKLDNWKKQKEYAKFILDNNQDNDARMLKVRLSIEGILQYLCDDNKINYRKPNDAIDDLYKRKILNLRDTNVYNMVRVISNNYCHYNAEEKNPDIDVNLAVQAWIYIMNWFLNSYLNGAFVKEKEPILFLFKSQSKKKHKEDITSVHDSVDDIQDHTNKKINHTANVLTNTEEIASSHKEKTDAIPVNIEADKQSISPIDEIDAGNNKSIVTKKGTHRNKRLIAILIVLFVIFFCGGIAYQNGTFDTLNSKQMIQRETTIHNRMWELTTGINGAVRSKYEIQDANHWIAESDKLLSDIDAEIKDAKTARVHDNTLKSKYIEILNSERESVAQTKQGIVDTTQGKTYTEGFSKGTDADMVYDQLHNDFVDRYDK